MRKIAFSAWVTLDGYVSGPEDVRDAAITFFDTVMAHMPFNNGLLFHVFVGQVIVLLYGAGRQ